MSVQEILNEIQRLPTVEQRELLEKLSSSLRKAPRQPPGAPVTEEEFLQILLAEGVIGNIPDPSKYTDEDDDFEPVEVEGKPVSETIIEERR